MPTITLNDPVTGTTVASGWASTNNANLRNLLNSGLDYVNLKGNPQLVANETIIWDGSNFIRSTSGNGILNLGNATTAKINFHTDTAIYRGSGGNILQTDNVLTLSGLGANINLRNSDTGSRPAIKFAIGNEANDRFQIQTDGHLYWGPGGAGALDTNLYRVAANWLQTDGLLRIGGSDSGVANSYLAITPPAFNTNAIATKANGDAQYRYVVRADGQISWGSGGAGFDTNFYRSGAGALKTDGTLQSGTGLAGGQFAAVPAGVGSIVFSSLPGNNGPNNYFQMQGSGKMEWGAGAGSAVDTNLYRSAAGMLKTDHTMISVGNSNVLGFEYNPSAAAGSVLVSLVQGESFGRFGIDVSGTLNWGPGSSGNDTNLYRGAADRLKTDDLFDATGLALATKQKAGTPADGDWAVAPPNGTLIVDSTNNKIWARVGGTWKGVVIA